MMTPNFIAASKCQCAKESILILHDGRERLRVERSAAYECAVNLFFRHQRMCVLRLDGAAIEDAQFIGEFLAEGFGRFGSYAGMCVGGDLRGSGLSGADAPSRFVGAPQADRFLGRDLVEGAETLAAQYVIGEPGFALFEDFSYADDRDESGFEGGLQLEIDRVIGFAEVLAALGVSNDDVSCAHC